MTMRGLVLALGMSVGAALGQGFTLEQVLSAPFCSELRAAPHGERVAWVANERGARNIWVADLGVKGFAARRLTAWTEDDGRDIGDVAWSPDRQSVVFVRGGDFEEEGAREPNPAELIGGVEQDVDVASLTGGPVRVVGRGWSPTVSPDGKTLVYVAKDGIMAVDFTEASAKPKQMFPARGSVGSPVWSPDGKRLAFVSGRGDHGFVGVYDLAAKTLRYMAPSTGSDDSPEWSPDGTKIALVRRVGGPRVLGAERAGAPWSIVVADAATGEGRVVWTAMDGKGSVFHGLSQARELLWTADGKLVFPWERDGWLHLYAMDAEGGEAKLLTPDDSEVGHAVLGPGRRGIVFDSNAGDIDRRHIWRVGADAKAAPMALTHGDAIEVAPVITESGSVVVMLADARVPTRPAVVSGGGMHELAPAMEPVEYPAAKLVVPQEVVFPGADGLMIHGQLFLPATDSHAKHGADDSKHPAVVFFHGGSRRQMLLGYNSMGYYSNAYAMNEYLASQGYVVLSVNYRSGTGYGMEFREALNYGISGASEYNDALGAGMYLRGRADVEPAKIGVWGGSWGGYLVALSLARASNLFAAGVDFHGVHDWTALRSNMDATEAATALASSPIADVKTWRSPVLLIQGDDDRNVPFSQMVKLSEALGRQHVPFEEKVFPDEIHGFLLWRDWVEAYGLTAEFLGRKLASPTVH